MKAVCDTNIFISSLNSPGGVSDEVIHLAKTGTIKLFISTCILSEIKGVLVKKFGATKEKAQKIAADIEHITTLVRPTQKVTVVKKDFSDNKILECALEARTDYIISGDIKHLQSLKKFQGIPILGPAQFLALISSKV